MADLLTLDGETLCSRPWKTLDRWSPTVAKTNTVLIRLISTADTGYYYVTKKNPRTQTEKLQFRKYDPRARKHVLFKEAKIK